MFEVITSMENSYIKKITALRLTKFRDETGLFVLAGIRLAEEAAQSDWQIEACLFTPDSADSPRINSLIKSLTQRNCRILQISQKILRKICDTEQPQGIIAIVKKRLFNLADILAASLPLIVVLDAVQDPGNAGSIIRAADAAGASGIITLPGCTDLYNSKAVRTSMGSVFHLPIVDMKDADLFIRIMAENNIEILATAWENSEVYYKSSFLQPLALVLGNEGNGINSRLLANSDKILNIPMPGQAESLNVGQAAAVLLLEAARQRTESRNQESGLRSRKS